MSLTVLNFSGGKQSSCLLWMLLKGDIPRPERLLVLNADPGMENSGTYEYMDRMAKFCGESGIDFATAPGPNLYQDLIQLSASKAKRADNPPYWTLDAKGKRGQLMQKCTKHYKIAPMDRQLRRYMEANFGISAKSKRIPEGFVEKWIGFSADEERRIEPSRQKYIRFRYPLIEIGMTNADVMRYFDSIGETPPPRSVCNACFAHGSATLAEMKHDRPADWEQACRVDDSIRDLSGIGVTEPAFVSDSCKPLREFDGDGRAEDGDEMACDSGYCFV